MNKKLAVNFQLQTTDFELGEPPESDGRHYFETSAAGVEVNRNGYAFTEHSLKQMQDGYREGLPILALHDKHESLGIGQTNAAEIKDNRLLVQAYITKDISLNNGPFSSTNDYIAALKDGFMKNMSVSVMVENATCSVCENKYTQFWGCEKGHVAGKSYDIDGKKVTAHAVIQSCDPVELSFVSMGADPKAQVTETAFGLNSQENKGEPEMSSDNTQAEIEALKAKLDAADLKIKTFAEDKVKLETEIADLKKEINDNTVIISDGKLARNDAIEDYIKEFVRYKGEGCTVEDRDRQKRFASTLTLAELKENAASYKEIADAKYAAGRELVETKDAEDEKVETAPRVSGVSY